jgi:NAD(P)-dependent dehydrogenase (short-subunit alcohol dehydrogenase family)
VTDRASFSAFIDATVQLFGVLDVLVNNAGTQYIGPTAAPQRSGTTRTASTATPAGNGAMNRRHYKTPSRRKREWPRPMRMPRTENTQHEVPRATDRTRRYAGSVARD